MPKFNIKLGIYNLQAEFTPENTNFKTHFKLNQGRMKSDYLSRVAESGEEPSELADEAFGMGQFNEQGPHPGLLGRSLDQFFGVTLVPKTPGVSSKRGQLMAQQKALAINPEFPSISEDSRPAIDAPNTVTLGHLLQTPSFLVTGADGRQRTLGSMEDSNGQMRDFHPAHSLARGVIVERRLREEAMGRLQSHPAIKMHAGEINWTPEAHQAVQEEVERFRKNVRGLYHGGGVTLEDGSKIEPLYLSKNAGNFITDVSEHFDPAPGHEEAFEKAMTAFGNTTKSSDIRTMRDRAHSPWSQVYDTSFQRRIENSDDSTLKDVFKTHLGERGQHRYIGNAPIQDFSTECNNWKTALADRMRQGTRGLDQGVPSPSQAELIRSPQPVRTKNKRTFSSKPKKFFFNPSNSK